MKLLGAYRNGNYFTSIYHDGTKVRETEENEFIPDRMESCDLKITNMCDKGCLMCHENSTPDGKHANLNHPVIDTFLPFTEIAIGGGNPLSHPDLESFLEHLKILKCIPSMTVNQIHFMKEQEKIADLVKKELIYGLGVSLDTITEDFCTNVKKYPNAIVHVIAGLVSLEQLKEMSEFGIRKILILGYKKFRRGETLYEKVGAEIDGKITELKDNLQEVVSMFEVVSFDNLALEQLNVKSILSQEEWDEFYMGDDGNFTMYIDLVKEEYTQSSTNTERFPLKDTVNNMFLDIRERKEMKK